MQKVFIAIAISVLGVLLLISFSKKTVFQTQIAGKKIKVFDKRNLKSLISPHVSEVRVLQIDGEKFAGLRGFEELKEINSLLFVTDEAGGAFIHVFDLQRGNDIKVSNGDAFNFGLMLGADTPDRDKVKILNSKSILLSTEGYSFRQKKKMTSTFLLDLDKKTVSTVEATNAPAIK